MAGTPTPRNEARHQSKLRWEQFNLFIDAGITEANLTPAAALTWLVIYRHARDGVAAVSIARVEDSAGLSRITARRALKALERAGLLKVIERGTSVTRPTRYRIRPTLPPNGSSVNP